MIYLPHALCYRLEVKKWNALSHYPCPYRAYSLTAGTGKATNDYNSVCKCCDRQVQWGWRQNREAFQGGFPGKNSYAEGSKIHYNWFGEIINWTYHRFSQICPTIHPHSTYEEHNRPHRKLFLFNISQINQVSSNSSSLRFQSIPYSLLLWQLPSLQPLTAHLDNWSFS